MEKSELFGLVRVNAFRQLPWSRIQTTNLYLDERIYETGDLIGPPHQNIHADRRSVLIFADDDPLANFSHTCRYLLYDAESGELHREVQAKFPPYVKARPETLQVFHEPVRPIASPNLFTVKPQFRCPIIIPDGDRYAILFSGMSNKRHLNDLEFLYRTLIDIYAFESNNIYVLSYDGTLNTQDGVPTQWPGDNTAYRINVTGQGTRNAFEAAINDLKGRLKRKDTLLIHTNNHGDYDGTPGTAYICTHPNFGPYYATDFSNKLAELAKHRNLIVMMEQCNSGGFNSMIIAKSTADATSIASAATETESSYASPDGNWDSFARDWVAAQAGHDPFGAGLAFNPDTNADGRIEAEEAYAYADAIKNPSDSPNFSESSEAGGDITLGQEYIVWWCWWCWIFREILEVYYIKLPPHEYYAKLREVQPELSKLVTSLDKSLSERRDEFTEKIRAVISPIFEKGKK